MAEVNRRWSVEEIMADPEGHARRLFRPEDEAPLWDYRGGFGDIPDQVVPAPYCGAWLRAGTYTLLFARAGMGKSAVCADLIAKMKSGRDWMGQPTHDPGRVVWINGDMQLWQIQERMAFMGKYRDVELIHVDNKNLLLHPNELLAVCEGAGLVVFDNFSALFHLDDVNKSESWRPFNDLMKRIYSTGTAVIMQHHEGKGEGASSFGSSAQEWPATNIIRLSVRDLKESEVDKLPGFIGDQCSKIFWHKHRMSDKPEGMLFCLQPNPDGSISCNTDIFLDDFGKKRVKYRAGR